jgi:molybdopterin synthase catalytic subunit
VTSLSAECDVRDAETHVQAVGASVIMDGMKDVADPIRLIALRETPLSLDEVHAAVGDTSAGGTVVFVGTVRDHDGGKDVAALEYSAHPSAEQELRRVAEKVVADFPVVALAAVHRVGALQITDAAVIVAVSCAHRGEAFEACRRLIDDIKHTVPIWKYQRFADGAEEWVSAC